MSHVKSYAWEIEMTQFKHGTKSRSRVFLLRWLIFQPEKIEMAQEVEKYSTGLKIRFSAGKRSSVYFWPNIWVSICIWVNFYLYHRCLYKKLWAFRISSHDQGRLSCSPFQAEFWTYLFIVQFNTFLFAENEFLLWIEALNRQSTHISFSESVLVVLDHFHTNFYIW